MIEVNVNTYQFRKVPFTLGGGANFKVNAYAKMTTASSAT